ncbi:ferritin family protein, partial [Chloroflexota bacterium]
IYYKAIGGDSMGIFISGSELVHIAIGIERNGAAFYDSLAESNENVTARDVYKHLATIERNHIETFQNMLSHVGDYQPPETYTEEYDLYLKALVDSSVFRNEQIAREMAQKVSSEAEALHIGLGAEKDSILFYSEMRGLVHQSDRNVIDRIIEEEKTHLKRLLELLRRLGN